VRSDGSVRTEVLKNVIDFNRRRVRQEIHTSPRPKPPTVTAAQLNSILLTETRINTIMGASHMQAADVVQKMANESASVLPANCIGALYTAENATYGGSDWSGVSDQSLQQQSAGTNTDVGHSQIADEMIANAPH
jgi:hypothetical protein